MRGVVGVQNRMINKLGDPDVLARLAEPDGPGRTEKSE